MTSRKLVFLDIDGTLTSSINHVPASALTACRAARKNGHLLYIATGRSRVQVSSSVVDIGFDGIICSGGAYIDIGGQIVFSSFIPKALLERLMVYFNERNAGYSLELPEKVLTSPQYFSSTLPRPVIRLFDKTFIPLSEDFDHKRVCKVVFMESKNVCFAHVQNEFSEDCEIFRLSIPVPGMSGGEISVKGIHKGTAAAWVARYHGIDREDTIAFGDSDNDRLMLEYAGVGVAMGNADEALKQVADDVAGYARCGGLAKAFRKYGLV
jgi:Cof subfamily protein (haloacid dehalogenase superfamily)